MSRVSLLEKRIGPYFRNLSITSTILGLVLLVVPAALTAQSRPVEPPPLEPTAGFEQVLSWVEDHRGHTAFARELERLVAMAEDVEDLRRIGDTIVPLITDRGLLAETAGRLASSAMIVRDYERAADLFETAYLAGGGRELAYLFGQAQALLQTGALSGAEQRARTVVAETDDYELKRRAYALVARSLHLADRHQEAARMLETLAELDDPGLVEPDTLLLQSSVLSALDGNGESALARLEKLHPESVAHRLVRGESVHEAALPANLIAAPADTEELPAADETPRVTAIQVGSFSDPDNAEHLAEDLRELGLDAHTSRIVREGSAHEVVLVGLSQGTTREASRVLGVLREAGYDGFLIY